MNVSVVMATYNGERYIKEQLDSIMPQLSRDDEIVISDDKSTDSTLNIIENYQKKYTNIKLVYGPCEGVGNNFQNAILHSKNELIILSDQDDVWDNNKIEIIKESFLRNPEAGVIMHNGVHFGEKNNTIIRKYKKGVCRNILSSCYWGCCMAIKAEYIRPILPLGKRIISHDQLIGLVSEKYNKTVFIDENLIRHRFHMNNQTKARPIMEKIKFRIVLFLQYLLCLRKIRTVNANRRA